MKRASVLLALVFAAVAASCSGSDDNHIVDGHQDGHQIDAPGTGSGSDSMALFDPHPHDNKLELLVAGLSVVVVLGPVYGARKRRFAI